jgi:hypothetical protein
MRRWLNGGATGRTRASRRPGRRAVPLLVLAALSLPAAAGSAGAPRVVPPAVHRLWQAARPSLCDRSAIGQPSYRWPLRPFDRQHPVRGFFGDPRTVTTVTLGEDQPGSPGSFSFHNGVDIFARTGAPVYPVVSGTAQIGYADEVIVVTADFRRFQYFHIRPAVRPGEQVVAGRTVLGTVEPRWHHLHFGEIDGFRVHNPLDPGHLEPYRDGTIPTVDEIVIEDEHGGQLDPGRVHGTVSVSARAADAPPLPVPGFWFGFPVTPALVSWTLTAADGRPVIRDTIAADFRRREPPNRDFWRVYAEGTYQNFPVFAHHYFFGRRGRYFFDLTKQPLDTRRLRDGRYRLRVSAADVCGNRGTLTEEIRILNGGGR